MFKLMATSAEKGVQRVGPPVISHVPAPASCYVAVILQLIFGHAELEALVAQQAVQQNPLATLLHSVLRSMAEDGRVGLSAVGSLQKQFHADDLLTKDSSQNCHQDPTQVLIRIAEHLGFVSAHSYSETKKYDLSETSTPVSRETLSPQKAEREIVLPGKGKSTTSKVSVPFELTFCLAPAKNITEAVSQFFRDTTSVNVPVYLRVDHAGGVYDRYTARKYETERKIGSLPQTIMIEFPNVGAVTQFDTHIEISGAVFRLEKIVCHQGGRETGHETCFVLTGGQWFYVDDMAKGHQKVDFEQYKWSAQVVNTGRTFVYSDLECSSKVAARRYPTREQCQSPPDYSVFTVSGRPIQAKSDFLAWANETPDLVRRALGYKKSICSFGSPPEPYKLALDKVAKESKKRTRVKTGKHQDLFAVAVELWIAKKTLPEGTTGEYTDDAAGRAQFMVDAIRHFDLVKRTLS